MDVRVRTKNPTVQLVPITTEEIEDVSKSYTKLYYLSTTDGVIINVGIPDMQAYFAATGNMYTVENDLKKAPFKSVSSRYDDLNEITDRPVFELKITDGRTVEAYNILNNIETSLESIINDGFSLVEQSKKR